MIRSNTNQRLNLGLHGDKECSAENCINLLISEYSTQYDYAGNKKFIGIFKINNDATDANNYCEGKTNGKIFMPKNAREITVYRYLIYKTYGEEKYKKGNDQTLFPAL